MNITKRTRLGIGAVGVCAAVGLAAGGAFTAGGLHTTGQASADQFVGGTITQTVSGATLSDISFSHPDPAQRQIDTVTLTFSAIADGKTVSIAFTGAAAGTGWACSNTSTLVSTCTSTTPANDVTSIDVTVS